jgi:hypothetical protein
MSFAKIVVILFAAASSQLLLNRPVLGQNSQASCQIATSDVARAISSKGAFIGVMEHRQVDDPSTPYPGSESLLFGFGRSLEERSNYSAANEDSAAANILSSPKLTMSWAKIIISACPNVSHVSFNQRYTGWSVRYFRFPNGEVRKPFCVENSIRNPPWGSDCCCS